MFEQDRMIMRLQQRALADTEILVCFLAGSYGRRAADGFSDLDVALVYGSEAARDAAWRQRRELVQGVMPYVPARSFDATHVRPFLHIALYSNGSKVDYRFETQTQLLPNPWDRDIRLLKDSDHWGERFQATATGTHFPQQHLTSTELTQLDDRFWVMAWDILRLLWRGDHQKPFPIYLQLLHVTLPPLLDVLPPQDPAHLALRQASFSQNTKATARHMAQLVEAYVAARTAVIRRFSLAFIPNENFETNIRRLIQRHTS